jgi:hypothetical protein
VVNDAIDSEKEGFMAQRDVSVGNDAAKWALFMHRTTHDLEFRARAKADPRAALAECGIDSKAKRIVVHEFDPDEHHFILPPVEQVAKTKTRARGATRPYSKEAPSTPMVGAYVCALTFPDDRISWGVAEGRKET